jgi:translation elongation factor P/translation initiation factor 5A
VKLCHTDIKKHESNKTKKDEIMKTVTIFEGEFTEGIACQVIYNDDKFMRFSDNTDYTAGYLEAVEAMLGTGAANYVYFERTTDYPYAIMVGDTLDEMYATIHEYGRIVENK